MADRAKAWTELNHVPGATLTTDGTGSGALGNVKDQIVGASWYSLALGGNPLPHWVAADFLAAKSWDTVAIYINDGTLARAPKDFKIQSSDNGVDWADVVVVADFFGAAAPATGTRFQVVSFTRQAAKRHIRLYFTGAYAGADYVAFCEFAVWDSTLLGGELFAAAPSVLTFYDAQAGSSKANFTDRTLSPTYGWYATLWGGTLEIDFGSLKYLGGFVVIAYTSSGYTPKTVTIYTSATGARTDWQLVETIDVAALGIDATAGRLIGLAFSRIHRARYLRIVGDKQAGKSGCVLWWNGELHEPLEPAVPPDPTALVAAASPQDASAVEVRWSQAAGDDNALADLDWEVERKLGAGAFALVATVPVRHLVDSGLAAGSYTYRVRAKHRFHGKISGYATGTALAVPAGAEEDWLQRFTRGRKQYELVGGVLRYRVYDPTDDATLMLDQEAKDRAGAVPVLDAGVPVKLLKSSIAFPGGDADAWLKKVDRGLKRFEQVGAELRFRIYDPDFPDPPDGAAVLLVDQVAQNKDGAAAALAGTVPAQLGKSAV